MVHCCTIKARNCAWRVIGTQYDHVESMDDAETCRCNADIPWATRRCPLISNVLWVQESLLRGSDDLAENQGVSKNQLKEGGSVAGRAVQAEGTAWLEVLRQEGAEFVRSWLDGQFVTSWRMG